MHRPIVAIGSTFFVMQSTTLVNGASERHFTPLIHGIQLFLSGVACATAPIAPVHCRSGCSGWCCSSCSGRFFLLSSCLFCLLSAEPLDRSLALVRICNQTRIACCCIRRCKMPTACKTTQVVAYLQLTLTARAQTLAHMQRSIAVA